MSNNRHFKFVIAYNESKIEIEITMVHNNRTNLHKIPTTERIRFPLAPYHAKKSHLSETVAAATLRHLAWYDLKPLQDEVSFDK